MSNKSKPRLSLRGDPNAPTMEPIEQAVAAINKPTLERPMEAVQEKTVEVNAVTAKQMAEEEATNAQRARDLVALHNAEPAAPDVTLIEVAARGYDALNEAYAKHNAVKPKEYVPPPRTPRQMANLQEELEAGRRAQQRAEAHYAANRPPPPDPVKEGFNTVVYRPGDSVPDPTVPAASGSVAGSRQFGSDAP